MPRTDDELQAASEHLLYEISMLRGTADELARSDGSNAVLTCALLEAFLVHARVLLHCFYPEGRVHEDDVLAKHFFADPAVWEAARPPLATVLVDVRRRVNGELAHLSYRRGPSLGRPDWHFGAVMSAIDEVAAAFCRSAARERLSPRWRV